MRLSWRSPPQHVPHLGGGPNTPLRTTTQTRRIRKNSKGWTLFFPLAPTSLKPRKYDRTYVGYSLPNTDIQVNHG